MLAKLERILSLEKMNQNYDWKKVEDLFKIKFPNDYKIFIDNFGEGGINDFLWILSPFSECDNLNTIYKFKAIKEAYEIMKKELPEICEFKFWENGKGIFPWAITDNGDELFWNYNEKSIDIVIFSSRYSEKQIFYCSMAEFLVELLEKKKVCSIFPNDFIREENYYEL
jgi:hypothetical protein